MSDPNSVPKPDFEPTFDDLMDLEQFLDSRPDIREMLEED